MPIDENFYKAFEDKFIGEEEEIKCTTPNKLFLEKLNSYKSLLNSSLSLSDVLWDESVKIMRDNINEMVKDAG